MNNIKAEKVKKIAIVIASILVAYSFIFSEEKKTEVVETPTIKLDKEIKQQVVQAKKPEPKQTSEEILENDFLPPLPEQPVVKKVKVVYVEKASEEKKHLNFKEMLEQQDRELMKSYSKINSSDMNINIKRNVELPKNSDKVVLRNDLLPEQPKAQDEVIDNSQTYLVIIDGEPKTLSGKEYRAYLNSQNSNKQVKLQSTEDYSLDSGVDDFLSNIKPEPIKPRKAEQSDDEIPSLEALMD
jgi:type IV secretory pathway VirB10-like protein